MRFCSLFTAKPIVGCSDLPGQAFLLQSQDGAASARPVKDILRGVAKRHSRYQFLMNFRLHGSRFATAASIIFHLVCAFILFLSMVILYRDVTGRNSLSNGATAFCSTKCQNNGVCSTFEPLSSSSASSGSSSLRPADRCSCLPGFYGDSCETDLRSAAAKQTAYSFSTALFKNVYEMALVHMTFITACICILLLSLARAIANAVVIAASIKRIRPVCGSIRYHRSPPHAPLLRYRPQLLSPQPLRFIPLRFNPLRFCSFTGVSSNVSTPFASAASPASTPSLTREAAPPLQALSSFTTSLHQVRAVRVPAAVVDRRHCISRLPQRL
jgi:hypothetical protein